MLRHLRQAERVDGRARVTNPLQYVFSKHIPSRRPKKAKFAGAVARPLRFSHDGGWFASANGVPFLSPGGCFAPALLLDCRHDRFRIVPDRRS